MPLGLVLRITDATNNTHAEHRFARFPVRLGRNPLNDLQLNYPFVSQFHAVLDQYGAQVVLRDLGSKNGTTLPQGRAPAHEPVALPQNSFAISSLLFELRMENIDPRTVPREQSVGAGPRAQAGRFMATVADARSAGDIAAAIARVRMAEATQIAPVAAQVAPSAPPPDAAKLYPYFQQYRSAWSYFLYALSETSRTMPPAQRAALFEWAKTAMQGVENEPEFVQLLASSQGKNLDPTRLHKAEVAALNGLKQLAAIYLPLMPLGESEEDVNKFLAKLRDTLDVFFKCFIPLRDGYRAFTSEMHLQRQKAQGAEMVGANAVENAKDARDLASSLLNWKDEFSTGHQAVEGTFADIMIHQLALLNGVMRGVKSIVAELSPKATEDAMAEAERTGKVEGFRMGPYRFRALWNLYKTRFADVDDGDKRTFSMLFGGDFARTYAALVDGGSSDQAPAAGQSMVPPPPQR